MKSHHLKCRCEPSLKKKNSKKKEKTQNFFQKKTLKKHKTSCEKQTQNPFKKITLLIQRNTTLRMQRKTQTHSKKTNPWKKQTSCKKHKTLCKKGHNTILQKTNLPAQNAKKWKHYEHKTIREKKNLINNLLEKDIFFEKNETDRTETPSRKAIWKEKNLWKKLTKKIGKNLQKKNWKKNQKINIKRKNHWSKKMKIIELKKHLKIFFLKKKTFEKNKLLKTVFPQKLKTCLKKLFSPKKT